MDVIENNKRLGKTLWDGASRLKDNKLYANEEKSEFCMLEIEFLGHIMINSIIKLNGKKVDAIKKWK